MNTRLAALTIALTMTACATAAQLEALAVTASLACAGGRAADAADQQAGAVVAVATCWWADYMAGLADRRRDEELAAAAAKLRSALEAEAISPVPSSSALDEVAKAHAACVEIERRNALKSQQ